MEAVRFVLYALAIVTSLGCTVLLVRGWRLRRYPLLLWSSLCFAGLTVNNALLFLDLVVFPNVDLRLWRLLASLAGVLCMLYAFIREVE
jgi:hypothetical protein